LSVRPAKGISVKIGDGKNNVEVVAAGNSIKAKSSILGSFEFGGYGYCARIFIFRPKAGKERALYEILEKTAKEAVSRRLRSGEKPEIQVLTRGKKEMWKRFGFEWDNNTGTLVKVL
jgi:hypothetical protein